MSQENPAAPVEYRGWKITVIYCHTRALWLVDGTHGPRQAMLGLSNAGPALALDDARRNIDANYSLNAEMLLEEAAVLSAKLPPWVCDEEFLKGRGS